MHMQVLLSTSLSDFSFQPSLADVDFQVDEAQLEDPDFDDDDDDDDDDEGMDGLGSIGISCSSDLQGGSDLQGVSGGSSDLQGVYHSSGGTGSSDLQGVSTSSDLQGVSTGSSDLQGVSTGSSDLQGVSRGSTSTSRVKPLPCGHQAIAKAMKTQQEKLKNKKTDLQDLLVSRYIYIV